MHEDDRSSDGQSDSRPLQRSQPQAHRYLGGKSPLLRSIEKQRDVVVWTYEHGPTSADLIRQVARQEARGYASKLVQAGLISETPIASGGYVRGVPRAFYTLTELGVAEAERHVAAPMKYLESNPAKVTQRLLRHNFIAQQVTLDMTKFSICRKYLSDKRLAMFMAGKPKRPDVVWYMFDEKKVGVEIELNSKWDRDLDQFIAGIVDLMSEEDQSIKLDEYRIFSDSPPLLENYKRAMGAGMPLRCWGKSPTGKWVVTATKQVPDWLQDRVYFSNLDTWARDHGRKS